MTDLLTSIIPVDEAVIAASRPGRRSFFARLAPVAWVCVGLGVLAVGRALGASQVPQLPGPAVTMAELGKLLPRAFATDAAHGKGIGLLLLASLGRVFSGFLVALVIGVPLGLFIGANRRAWQAANPVIQLLRPVSPLAWFPIWLIVFKNAAQASLLVIFVTALWPIVVNTASSAASIPRDQRNVARVVRFGRFAYVRHVLIPNSRSGVVTGMRLSMGTAWMVIVAVEMLSGKAGIGFFVWDSYNAFNFARVLSAAVMVGAIGLLLDLGFLRLGKAVALKETHA